MAIPLFDTKTPLAPLRAAMHVKLAEVYDDGNYILGPEVAAFERELATHFGTARAVGVANGTDALVLALRAALTEKTKLVMVVHLFGNVAPVAEIEALGGAHAPGDPDEPGAHPRAGGRGGRGRPRCGSGLT